MAGATVVTERDLRTMLRIVAAPDDVDTGDPLPRSVLLGVLDLIGCDFVAFVFYDPYHPDREEPGLEVGAVPALTDEQRQAADRAFVAHYWDNLVSCYPTVTGDLVSVTTTSDFQSDRVRRSTPMYQECYRPQGFERNIRVCLPAPGGCTYRLLLWRGPGPDFSWRDRALLTVLRPHLLAAYRRQLRRRRTGPELTTRQVQLLRLVAAGHTNRQIARRLAISEGTVRKHLEHIYGRLKVDSRTAAVTRAFGDQP